MNLVTNFVHGATEGFQNFVQPRESFEGILAHRGGLPLFLLATGTVYPIAATIFPNLGKNMLPIICCTSIVLGAYKVAPGGIIFRREADIDGIFNRHLSRLTFLIGGACAVKSIYDTVTINPLNGGVIALISGAGGAIVAGGLKRAVEG